MKRYYWVALVGLVGACGEETTPPPTDPAVTLTLLRHDNPAYGTADDAFFEEYKKAHDKVTIKPTTIRYPNLAQTLLADLKAGKLDFDIVRVQPSWVCTFADQIADVPEDVLTLSEAQNTFFAAPLGGSTCGGKLKGLPVEYNLEYGGLVVNMTKYEEKHNGAKPNWATWTDFINDAASMTEYDPPLVGAPKANGLDIAMEWPQPVKHIFFSYILQKGGKYWDGGGDAFDSSKGHVFNFKTPEAKAAFTDMVSWITQKKVMHTSLIPTENTFVTTRLAIGSSTIGWGSTDKPLSLMGYVGTWGIPSVKGQLPAGSTTKYEFYAHPPLEGTTHKFVQNSGWSFVVPKNSKNQKAAFALLKAMVLSPETMRKWAATTGALPALKVNGTEAAAAGDPTLSRVQPLLAKGQWVGFIPAEAIETVEGALMSNYFAVVKGNKTIDQALDDMQKQSNDALALHK
jgi:multiple sugar transport system substrate-binding protein